MNIFNSGNETNTMDLHKWFDSEQSLLDTGLMHVRDMYASMSDTPQFFLTQNQDSLLSIKLRNIFAKPSSLHTLGISLYILSTVLKNRHTRDGVYLSLDYLFNTSCKYLGNDLPQLLKDLPKSFRVSIYKHHLPNFIQHPIECSKKSLLKTLRSKLPQGSSTRLTFNIIARNIQYCSENVKQISHKLLLDSVFSKDKIPLAAEGDYNVLQTLHNVEQIFGRDSIHYHYSILEKLVTRNKECIAKHPNCIFYGAVTDIFFHFKHMVQNIIESAARVLESSIKYACQRITELFHGRNYAAIEYVTFWMELLVEVYEHLYSWTLYPHIRSMIEHVFQTLISLA